MRLAVPRYLQFKNIAHNFTVCTGRRTLTISSCRMVEVKDLSPSKGEDVEALAQRVTALVDNGRWIVCNEGKGLERQFKFKTFKATWDFMNHIAAECKKRKHHPEWTNIYNKTHIRWTTHNPVGMSHKDANMAQFCDEAGEQFGELPAEPGESKVDGEGMTAGDCCRGKKTGESL